MVTVKSMLTLYPQILTHQPDIHFTSDRTYAFETNPDISHKLPKANV